MSQIYDILKECGYSGSDILTITHLVNDYGNPYFGPTGKWGLPTVVESKRDQVVCPVRYSDIGDLFHHTTFLMSQKAETWCRNNLSEIPPMVDMGDNYVGLFFDNPTDRTLFKINYGV